MMSKLCEHCNHPLIDHQGKNFCSLAFHNGRWAEKDAAKRREPYIHLVAELASRIAAGMLSPKSVYDGVRPHVCKLSVEIAKGILEAAEEQCK